jgi:hypothetical protein
MELGSSSFLHKLVGKKLIAYGTGHAGKLIIPFLANSIQVQLIGVTNSKVQDSFCTAYLDTGLPLRSLQEWVQLEPDASVLITAFRGYDEIYDVCCRAGFQEVIFPPLELVEASMQSMEDLAESRMLSDLDALCLANEIRDTHKETFSKFKGCHKGQSVAVVGCGPTLNYYSQINGVVHIGTNSSFLRDGLKLDYYFLFHFVHEWCKKLQNYDFIKFFGVNQNDRINDKIPEYMMESEKTGKFFFSPIFNRFHANIEYYPLMGYLSIIFPALQFALYTRPKRIYLVGCDCSVDGHYDGSKLNAHINEIQVPIWIKGYDYLKKICLRHYPDTEIISVNPVGLKGIFHDVYTENYLSTHCGLKKNECEILNV